MIRHKLSLLVICAALATQGQVLCRWTADSSRSSQVTFDCYRGETLQFVPSFAAYGSPITNYTATLLWQTNGMGTAWWTTNILQFTPAMDVGANKYTVFIRAETTNGVNYRANGTITMRNAPGFTPNTLPLPVPSIDFATVTTTNAPWLLAELDPGIPDAITTAVAQAGTNAQDMADIALILARDYALTNPVTRLWSNDRFIDGLGNSYIVSNFWNMTFSADFAGIHAPANTNYLFTALDQFYLESLGMGRYWRMAPNEVRYLPSTLTGPLQWLPTTNSLVLDPVVDSGAEGYAYIQYWTTTNLVGVLATSADINAATTGLVTASITNGLATTAYVNAATTGLVTASITNGLATTAYVNAATTGLVTASITNGLATTASMIAATNGLAESVPGIVRSLTHTNQTWAAAGTNATYRMSWDTSNGTFRVEEILP